MFKVAFDLQDEGDWPPVLIERMWAEKTGKLQLKVLNTPFFARGIAFGDLISVRPDHERRELVFDGVVSESDHSTVRVVFMSDDHREAVETRLREAGFTIATLSQFESLIAIDVPPTTDYAELRAWLLPQEADEAIGFEEGAISAVHRAQLAKRLEAR